MLMAPTDPTRQIWLSGPSPPLYRPAITAGAGTLFPGALTVAWRQRCAKTFRRAPAHRTPASSTTREEELEERDRDGSRAAKPVDRSGGLFICSPALPCLCVCVCATRVHRIDGPSARVVLPFTHPRHHPLQPRSSHSFMTPKNKAHSTTQQAAGVKRSPPPLRAVSRVPRCREVQEGRGVVLAEVRRVVRQLLAFITLVSDSPWPGPAAWASGLLSLCSTFYSGAPSAASGGLPLGKYTPDDGQGGGGGGRGGLGKPWSHGTYHVVRFPAFYH